MLVFFGLLVALGLLIAVLSKINDSTDRGNSTGSNLDEINSVGPGQTQGVPECHYSELFAIDADDPDFAGTDFPIYPYECSGGRRRPWRKGAAQDTLAG